MHLLEPDTSCLPLLKYDACIAGTGILPPSTIVLDFIYGVAAYRCWGSGHDIKEVMQAHFTKHYKSIPIPPASLPSSDGDSSPDSDNDHDDKSYKPGQPTGRNHTLTMSDGMLHAMDDILMISMLLKGTTPELVAAERQRREEEEELHTMEASQVKVWQWMQSSPCVFSLLLA